MRTLQAFNYGLIILHSFLFFGTFVGSSPIETRDAISPISVYSPVGQISERGCGFSKSCPYTPPAVSSTLPSVSDLVSVIQGYGRVGNLDSLFYSGFGGAGAITMSKAWYCSNVGSHGGRGAVAWDGIVDNTWFGNQAKALAAAGIAADPFMKRLSQAFAEASSGTVYFFCPTGKDGTSTVDFPVPQTAWGGWEFPALTRNPNVVSIIQVDPSVRPWDLGHTIWSQGDPASPNAPLG